MTKENLFIKDLGDGLIMRHASPDDAEALAQFNGIIHVDPGEDFSDFVADWTRWLLTKPHPTLTPADFTIVEDTNTGQIVSSMNLIPQTWTYGGIPFGVGRPEIVGTDPAYRNRGLVRAQFEVVHQWCAERGYLVQGITGIPYYYRLFGYEMCIDLGGGQHGPHTKVPKLKDDQTEPYILRPAQDPDLAFIAELSAENASRYALHCPRDVDLWRHSVAGSPEDLQHRLHMIETPQGEPVGYISHATEYWGQTFPIYDYEIKAGHSWLEPTESMLRYIQKIGDQYAEKDDKLDKMERFYFNLYSWHPVYDVIPERLTETNEPYAWYLRVGDLPEFIQLIAPALEQRLAESYVAGYSGQLILGFYHSGIRLEFENGKLTAAENWAAPQDRQNANAMFPDQTFLQLLFGWRSLDEVTATRMDCYVNTSKPGTKILLNSLFPKQPSMLRGIN